MGGYVVINQDVRGRYTSDGEWYPRTFLIRSASNYATALIIKYPFLENTFDVAAAFRAGGSWQIDTDGTKHNVPPALEALEIQNVP